jgi:hypothetical protein
LPTASTIPARPCRNAGARSPYAAGRVACGMPAISRQTLCRCQPCALTSMSPCPLPACVSLIPGRSGRLGPACFASRQHQSRQRPALTRRLDGELAADCERRLFCDRQAEAEAVARMAAPVEAVEGPSCGLRVDACPGVAHLERDCRRRRAGLELDPSRRRVRGGVLCEVGQYALYQPGFVTCARARVKPVPASTTPTRTCRGENRSSTRR